MDWSVAYVAANSNSALPLIYRISAVWGAHEGSLLLWVLMLSGWTLAVSVFNRRLPAEITATVLAVLGAISVGFLLFMLTTSNPFARAFPVPADGRDLNPLLQDPGLIIHPPMLYMGYVGFSVAFAFAIAALVSGRLDAAWARWTRPWTTTAWMFLTLGITLGSWWAYNELGWGGWWFWDPVENASFMPWLVGTALIHSLGVTEKRGLLKSWTVLLAIIAFSLSLLGTFLVRSGVLVSVHAFATDPARGVFILCFLAIVLGSAFTLYAVRALKIASTGSVALLSREGALLINNVFLVVAAASVLLGTLYPLVVDALGVGKISVGPPYFNAIFLPLIAPLAALVGFATVTPWKRASLADLWKAKRWTLAGVALAGAALPVLLGHPAKAIASCGAILGLWALVSTALDLVRRVRAAGLGSIPNAVWGMSLAHMGLGVWALGVTFVSLYAVERDVRIAPGAAVEIAGYNFVLRDVQPYTGPNFDAQRGTLEVLRDGSAITTLNPEKRFYRASQQVMTEAAVDHNPLRDLYASLGEAFDNGDWSLRLYYKPMMRLVWGGGVMMFLGGLLAASDRRYRVVVETQRATAAATA
jgi:cytochrome c-type biogenesis protein CcmF